MHINMHKNQIKYATNKSKIFSKYSKQIIFILSILI